MKIMCYTFLIDKKTRILRDYIQKLQFSDYVFYARTLGNRKNLRLL